MMNMEVARKRWVGDRAPGGEATRWAANAEGDKAVAPPTYAAGSMDR